MSCEDIKNKLGQYLDGELVAQERLAVEQHLVNCPNCRRELGELKAIQSIGQMPLFIEPGDSYWQQLRESIGQQIESHQKTAAHRREQWSKMIIWLVPRKLSYRLIGLTATAVVAFFVIRFAFQRNESPQISLPPYTKGISQPAADSSAQMLLPRAGGLQAQRSTEAAHLPKATGSSLDSIDESIQLSAVEAQSRDPNEPLQSNITKNKQVPNGNLPLLDTEFTEMQSQSALANETRLRSRPTGLPQYHMVERAPSGAMKAMTVSKPLPAKKNQPEAALYNWFVSREEQLETTISRIELWKQYSHLDTNAVYQQKAMYHLAQLYYEYAQQQRDQENILEALNFYRENASLLRSAPESTLYRNNFMELEHMLKKTLKK